jgi:hypothetical protein
MLQQVVDVTNEVIRDYWGEFREVEPSENSLNGPCTTIDATRLDGRKDSSEFEDEPSFSCDDPVAPGEGSAGAETNLIAQAVHIPSPAASDFRLQSSSDLMSPASAGISNGVLRYAEPNDGRPASRNTANSSDVARSAASQLLYLGSGALTTTWKQDAMAMQPQLSDDLLPPLPQVVADTPDAAAQLTPEQLFADDGIFLPGSAYLELHSVLRNHMFETARSTYPSRWPSPKSPGYDTDVPVINSTRETGEASLGAPDETSHQLGATPKPAELTPEQEFVLWENWVDEIAPWVGLPLSQV